MNETPWRSLGDSNPCFRRERAIYDFETTATNADHGLHPKRRDGVLASKMAVSPRLALQNEARTPCYHFATQLGSRGRY
jgi:hypothetical protein